MCGTDFIGHVTSANFILVQAFETDPGLCGGQAIGENAALARALVEGVGVCARALGPDFVAGGRCMYTVLIPLLERIADPSPSVAAAASAAVGSICIHCGYSSFEQLVLCLLLEYLRTLMAISHMKKCADVFVVCCLDGRWHEWTKFALQVRANADYVVDGLCKQLRHLDNHPR